MKRVVSYIRVIVKLALSLVLGGLLCVSLFKNDVRIRESLTKRLTPFMSGLVGGNVSFSVQHISLMPLSIELGNVVSTPYEAERGQWTWRCPSLTIGCSWFDLIFYGTVALKLDMKQLDVDTLLEKKGLCVWKIIARIMEGRPSIPVFLQTLSVSQSTLHISQPAQALYADLLYSLSARKVGAVLHGDITLHQADGELQKRQLLENMQGRLSFDASNKLNTTILRIGADCYVDIPQLSDDKTCHITGSWEYDHGQFSLKNKSGSCVCDDIKLYTQPQGLYGTVKARIPIAYGYTLATNSQQPSPLTGVCQVQAQAGFAEEDLKLQGSLSLHDVNYHATNLLSSGTLAYSREHGVWNATVTAHTQGVTSLAGTISWNEHQGTGFVHLNNEDQVIVPGGAWSFLPKTVLLECERLQDGSINGKLECVAKNTITGSHIGCSVHGCVRNNHIKAQGTIDNKLFSLSGSLAQQPYLEHCLCSDAQGNVLVELKMRPNNAEHFVGTLSLGFVKELLKRVAHIDIQGQGTLECVGMYKDKKIYTQLNLIKGSLRVPMTCNVVNGIRGRCIIDPGKRKIELRDLHCSLYRGQLDCAHACVAFDQHYALEDVYAPVRLHDCLLNWKKDLFALISGQMLFTLSHHTSLLTGSLTLDRAQLKRNIFSEDFQRSFLGSSVRSYAPSKPQGMSMDVQVTTKNPVRIKTSFLETSAHLDVKIKGSLAKPDLAGRISLVSGSLAFPYKPLYITKGSLEFTSGHLSDPYIEINAKNKLKKYNVSLDVSGSLSQPEIMLEASPSLTEEQIIALLFAGSEQGSLNIVAPALVMQNLKNIIFGSDQSPTGMRKSFGYLFKPLERVHLIPSFTDQTGRGGLRAAVEIDVSDRCRAMIQKNFSLTEDTKVELDYAVSDDVNLRGVRDERGDISAEVEMRWKF